MAVVIPAFLILAPACAGDPPAPLDVPRPSVVHVVMDEYEFRFHRTVPPGRVVFEVINEGRLEHEAVLLEMPEGFPSIEVELRNEERRFIPTVVVMRRTAPGEQGTFAVNLQPGRYALVCFVRDADGGQHALKGMSADFRAGPVPAGASDGPVTSPAEPSPP